ncbi:MAG TPA: hypothetical protein VLE97_11640 [Gaiellaceae bacterium]|nr:hypothetical protein [Gaiellaceae bacterium]
MTSAQADALIASLPKPGGLRLTREGDQIVMSGGKHGSHSINTRASSAERLIIHWKGYVQNQGLSLGPDYSQSAPTMHVSQLARAVYRALRAAKKRSLQRGSIARKLGVGRRKRYSWAELDGALAELTEDGFVTSDGHGIYTAP